MQNFFVDRRVVLGFLGSSCLAGPVFSQEDGCAELRRAQFLAAAGVQDIDAWVLLDAPTILLNARIRLNKLKAALPAAGASLDDARRAELLNLIGSVGGTTLLFVGIAGAPVTSLILAGLALSSGLLIAEALTVPNKLNPTKKMILQTAGDVEKALAAAGASGPIAARTATNVAGTLVGGVTTFYNFMEWLKSLNDTVVAEAKFDALRSEIAIIETALAPLDDANAMREVRFDAMTALQRELSAFPCTVLD